MFKSRLTQAKEMVSIPMLWRHFALPGVPGKICRSPFREDKKPSFSVYAEDRRWCDFGTGESGDAVDFIGKVRGSDIGSAARELIELANGRIAPMHRAKVSIAVRDIPLVEKLKSWPQLVTPTTRDLQRIAESRGFPTLDGLHEAVRRDMLFCAQMVDSGESVRVWILTDPMRCTAQARRLDARKWNDISSKAKTLKGSSARWPVGVKALGDASLVILVEGAPDALAALTLAAMRYKNSDTIKNIGVCAMLGAGMEIHPVALPLLADRRIRIIPQLDAPDKRTGEWAALRWGTALSNCGATVEAFNLTGLFGIKNGKDLNDAVLAMQEGGEHDSDHELFSLFDGGTL